MGNHSVLQPARSPEGEASSQAVPERTIKPKRCRVCRREFIPRLTTQVCCSGSCAISYSRGSTRVQSDASKRVAIAQKREDREKLKTKRDRLKEAQRAFNAFIRERDRNLGCISCPMPAGYLGQWHASHYRSTAAAPELRFDELNVHKSCAQCNTFKSGNLVEYRLKLLNRIGPEAVEKLEGPHPPKKYTTDDLIEICRAYRKKLREMRP